MPPALQNTFIFHKVTGIAGLSLALLLAGCGGGPDKPATANDDDLVRIARQLHERGNDASAADFYTRALQRQPDDAGIHKEFGEVLDAHGDYVGAVTQYRAALGLPADENASSVEITSSDADLLRDYGRVLVRLGHPDVAQSVYARAVKLDPDDVRSLNGLGVSLDQMGNHVMAQKIYGEALDDKPNDYATLANLGHSYVLSGAYDDAIKLLEPHLHDSGATPALRQNLAEAYGMNGMDADAERVMRFDLSEMQVKHNLTYYRAQRSHLSAGGALYADLGTYPTGEMAEAHAEDIKARFAKETDGLAVRAEPKLVASGGTPSFSVTVTGFEHSATLRAFCDKLKEQHTACTSRTDK